MADVSVAEYALLALLAVAVVGIVRFEVFCFRDLARRSDHELRYFTRTGWLILVAVVIPLGGICYLYYGRPAD